jgi:PST family polysaccharide transporter
MCLFFGRQPFWPHFGVCEYRDLFRVASAEILNNLVNYTADNLPFIVIGKWLGATALGLFNRSFNFMHLPVKHFSIALGSVTFPVYAKIQRDIPRLGRAFLHTVSLTALVTVPVLLAMAVVPKIVIGGLLGAQWKPAATSFQILCLSGPFLAMMRVFGSVTHARAYVFSECCRQVIYLAFVTIALWLLFPYGLEGLALAVTLALIVRYFLLAHLSIKLAGVSWWEFLIAQVPGVVFGVVVATPVYVVSLISETLHIADHIQLAIVAVTAAVSLLMSCIIFPPSWFGDLYPFIVEHFGSALPSWLYAIVIAKLPATSVQSRIRKVEVEI